MDDAKTGRPSRLWRIVLVISLALNLAVAGIVVGAGVSGNFRAGPPKSFEFGLGPVGRALNQDERRAVGRQLRRDEALRGIDMRGQVTALVAALRSDPFDASALQAVVADQNKRVDVLQEKAQDALVAQIAAMSPERRAAFADRLEEEMRRQPRLRRNGSGG